MKKEKWMLQEISTWEQLSLVDAQTAIVLKERYTGSEKKTGSFLTLLFSIIGALLIGTGIILIAAKNWYALPLFVRISFAFLPLLISHGLAVFVVKCKYHSAAWREAVAIFGAASVFTAMAIVNQIFHLSIGYGEYVLICGLLSLPVMYILNAAAPLLIYYYTILNWAALNASDGMNALFLLGLFALGALFVFIQIKKPDARLAYMMWVTVIAGFPAVLIMGIMLEASLLLAVLCYFVLLLSVEKLPPAMLPPFKTGGIIGGLITISILTYESMWDWMETFDNVYGSIMIGIMLMAAVFFAVRVFKRDKLQFSFIVSLAFLCIMRYIWALNWFGEMDAIIPAIISNIILFSVGVGFVVRGAKHSNLLISNIGLAAICTLIVMRFFDSDMDFLWRGIVFLLLGIGFLLVNLKLLNARKKSNPEVGV